MRVNFERTVVLILCLLCLAPPGSARPGGEGDADQDLACGGSCHGDPGLRAESSAHISIDVEVNRTFAGEPLTLIVSVSDLDPSARGLVGIMLLSSLDGARDHPADAGWSIQQDPNGGARNYVEAVCPPSGMVSRSWILIPPTELGNHTLYASIHHGADSNPNEQAFQGINSTGLSLLIEEMPEDMPRIATSFNPPSSRDIGVSTSLSLSVENVDDVIIEWHLSGGGVVNLIQTNSEANGTFTAEIPALEAAGSIEWRAVLAGQGMTRTTPWYSLSTEPPLILADALGIRLQSAGLALLILGLSIALQRRFTSSGREGPPLPPDHSPLYPAESNVVEEVAGQGMVLQGGDD